MEKTRIEDCIIDEKDKGFEEYVRNRDAYLDRLFNTPSNSSFVLAGEDFTQAENDFDSLVEFISNYGEERFLAQFCKDCQETYKSLKDQIIHLYEEEDFIILSTKEVDMLRDCTRELWDFLDKEEEDEVKEKLLTDDLLRN